MYQIIDSDNYAEAGIETMIFPGGELHVKFRKSIAEDGVLLLKIRNWNDAGYAALVIDAISDSKWRAFIPYYPGARQDPDSKHELVQEGAVAGLYRRFGGTKTATGHMMLDSHIGVIYGDSITLERAEAICKRLEENGYASGNVVLGIGSYTYQYVTRDTYGHAIKATWCMINGQEHQMYKSPVTDDGTKFSAKGRIVIFPRNDGKLVMKDGLSLGEQASFDSVNLLKPVWSEGEFIRYNTLGSIRETLHK